MLREFGEHASLWRAANPSGTPCARSAVPAVGAVPAWRLGEQGGRCPGRCEGIRGEPAGVTHALSAHGVPGRDSGAGDCTNGVLTHGNKSLAGCYGSCSP